MVYLRANKQFSMSSNQTSDNKQAITISLVSINYFMHAHLRSDGESKSGVRFFFIISSFIFKLKHKKNKHEKWADFGLLTNSEWVLSWKTKYNTYTIKRIMAVPWLRLIIPESMVSWLTAEVVALKAAGINIERAVKPKREAEVCAATWLDD